MSTGTPPIFDGLTSTGYSLRMRAARSALIAS